MKAVQATFDEGLLDKLDRYCAARASGRSAAIREAVADYLRRKEAEETALRYQAGYGANPPDAELSGWADKGVWPETWGKRQFGAMRGRVAVGDAFSDPVPEAELAAWEA